MNSVDIINNLESINQGRVSIAMFVNKQSPYHNRLFMLEEMIYYYGSVTEAINHDAKSIEWPSWFNVDDCIDEYNAFVEKLRTNVDALNYVVGVLYIGCDFESSIVLPKNRLNNIVKYLFDINVIDTYAGEVNMKQFNVQNNTPVEQYITNNYNINDYFNLYE